MWKCHKCGKPVFFAERKQSLGYDWHPECLRCEECGKRLNPGQHAEHKGVPYCHVPCYGALFGPQLFGHGTRVESHKNFGQNKNSPKATTGPNLPRDHLESKLKVYNQYYNNKSMEIRSREVNNRLILEGALRVYWGVQGVIHLKEDDDQRTVVTVRKRNSCRYPNPADNDKDNDQTDSIAATTTTSALDGYSTDVSLSDSMTFDSCSLSEEPLIETNTTSEDTMSSDFRTNSSATLPSKLDSLSGQWDEIDELLQVERKFDEREKLYETMPLKLPSSQSSSSDSSPTKTTSETTTTSTASGSGELEQSDTFVTATSDAFSEAVNDDATLKPMDFEDFKKSVHQDYVNGANNFPDVNDDTLKKNQPIDPSRINDSLKLYGDNPLSKSFNEQALRTIDPAFINDTLNLKSNDQSHSNGKSFALQKSASASSNSTSYHQSRNVFQRGINRSKSGPDCYEFSDSEDEETLKPRSTIKRNGNARYINIKMDCYNQQDDQDSSRATDTISAAGELTETEERCQPYVTEDGVVLRRPPKSGSTAIKRRSGNRRSRVKLKRRCSINGHFYNRETSFFTPPFGSQMSVWVTSLVSTQEVINLILEKYKVDSRPENFSLFIMRDNGEQKRLKDDDYPLLIRVALGPHEDVNRLFLMDAYKTMEISNEVAQFLNLSLPECHAILERYDDELDREISKVKDKYSELRRRIISRMESLKVRL